MVKHNNVLSSLSYVAVALLLMAQYPSGPSITYFMLASGLLSMGSGLFHGNIDSGYKVRKKYQLLDEIGMYLVFTLLALMAMGAAHWYTILPVWLMYIGGAKYISSFHTLPVIYAIIVTGMVLQGIYIASIITTAVFGVALLIRHKDEPVGHGWLHPIWHLITAFNLGAIYLALIHA